MVGRHVTPATRNEGGCEFVRRLPRKMARRHARPGRAQTRPKRATHCHECHACHAKRRCMSDCATPATRNEGGCEFVPRLPRKMARRHARPGRAQTRPKRATHCHECHACHAKRRWMWVCATPATRNEGGCEFVPRLPRETRVDVSLCHACHAKWRGVTRDQGAPKPDPSAPPTAMSATPATRNEVLYVKFLCVKLLYVKLLYIKFVCVWSYCMLSVRSYGKCELSMSVCVWSYGMWEMGCDKVVMCEMVCDKVVCVWVCVKLLYIKFVCVLSLCVWSFCM